MGYADLLCSPEGRRTRLIDKNKPDLTRLEPGAAVGVHCIAQDSKGNLYVGEIYSERAQKFVPITTRIKK